MRVRRRARAEVEAQKALAVAAAHANAGLRAQLAGEPPSWSPPGLMPLAVDPPPLPPAAEWPPPAPPAPPIAPDLQGEFLRVLEVVTRMCDHVIEYIEADRAERRVLVETLGQIARAISTSAAVNGTANGVVPVAAREHVIGGSMPASPDPLIDLTLPEPATTAVEVRCRFGEGERWVDGFEIVDIEHREDGPHYRLRRQRDGAILPQLFDAANIRHVETFEELTAEQPASWSRL